MSTVTEETSEVAEPKTNKWVYLFDDGPGDDKALLGGKGAGLCEMTRAGLPVPPGLVVTTEACVAAHSTQSEQLATTKAWRFRRSEESCPTDPNLGARSPLSSLSRSP